MNAYRNRLLVRSQSRLASASTSSANFTISMAEPFDLKTRNYRCLNMPYLQVYRTSQTIQTGVNDLIDFTNGGPQIKATIAAGYYNGTTLAAAMQTALNNATAGWTVTYDSTTRLYTFANATPFTLLFLTGADTAQSPWKEVGYENSVGTSAVDSAPLVTSSTSPFPTNLSLPLSFLMRIKEMGEHIQTTDGVWASFIIPNTVSSGANNVYTEASAFPQKVVIPPSINILRQLTVTLLDNSGTQLDLRNSEFEFLLEFCSD